MKFRKRPVVIEAEQWYPALPMAGVTVMARCSHGKIHLHTPRCCDSFKEVGLIQTLEGPMIAEPGDWIITGVKGERYPCKGDIFALTYEPVE